MTPTTPTKSPVDTIRGAGNDLITFLHEASDMAIIGPNPNDDWHRRKRQVIENWDVAISSLSRPAQTMMSRDYEALYATLGVGNFAYVTMRIVGSEYSTKATAASLGMNDRTKAECIAEWSAVKLEWVAPLPSQTDGLEEAVAQFARNFCGKWATTFCSHDSVAVVVELREALEKFMQGRSLPRQKGEPVAWMTEDSHGRTMLFHDINEARTYCDEDEEPTALYK
mgnify:CR=1 FL=1